MIEVVYLLAGPPKVSETFLVNELRALHCYAKRINPTVLYTWPNGRDAGSYRLSSYRLDDLKNLRSVADVAFNVASRSQARRLGQMLKHNDVDIVHANFVNFPARVATELAHRLSVPVTATAHAADYMLQPSSRLKKTLSRLDHLFGISQATLNAIETKCQTSTRSSIVRACTSDIEPLSEQCLLASDDGKPLLITVARLIEKKGVDDCIEVASNLRALGVEFQWDVIGDGPLSSSLGEEIRRRGLDDYMRLLGALPHEEVLKRLSSSTICVLLSKRSRAGDEDGIPVVLLEAAALGVPIVGTSAGGISELLRPITGSMCRPGDFEGVTSLIVALLDSSTSRMKSRRAALARYAAEFSPQVQAERLQEQWLNLTGKA